MCVIILNCPRSSVIRGEIQGSEKALASYDDNPILRRSMRIQHYVHVKIPEIILAGGGTSRSRLSAQTAYRKVSEFAHAAFLRHEQEDRAEMTSLVPQTRSNEGVAFSA